MNNGRDVLIYLSMIYDGNYDAIIEAAARGFDPPFCDVTKAVNELKCQTLTFIDPNYPSYLKKLPCAPIVLYYYGDISLIDDAHHENNLGVVGTRHPTDYGSLYTEKIVREISHKCTVVSGMAKGIDAIAHQTAVNCNGKTVAVLGSGIDIIYPLENTNVYREIIEKGGLIISEFPPGSPPMGFHFPIRNRLIAMFSKALLVTEAFGLRSGTSITVHFASSYGLEVMCLPSPIEVENSFTNELLYEGAKLIRDGQDVLYDLGLGEPKIISSEVK